MTGSDARAGQEAARLLAAAQEWLRTSAPHLAPVASDGAPCSCPVCRAVSGLREADPDSVARWVDSAVAAATALATQAADLAAAATRSAPPTDADGSHDEDSHDGDSHDGDSHDGDGHDGDGHDGDSHDGDSQDGDSRRDDRRHEGSRAEGSHDVGSQDVASQDVANQAEERAGSDSDLGDLADEAPARASAGQDGAGSRGVRRIPVGREPGAATR